MTRTAKTCQCILKDLYDIFHEKCSFVVFLPCKEERVFRFKCGTRIVSEGPIAIYETRSIHQNIFPKGMLTVPKLLTQLMCL